MQLIFKYMTSQTATRKRKSTGKLETIARGKSKPEKISRRKTKTMQPSREGDELPNLSSGGRGELQALRPSPEAACRTPPTSNSAKA